MQVGVRGRAAAFPRDPAVVRECRRHDRTAAYRLLCSDSNAAADSRSTESETGVPPFSRSLARYGEGSVFSGVSPVQQETETASIDRNLRRPPTADRRRNAEKAFPLLRASSPATVRDRQSVGRQPVQEGVRGRAQPSPDSRPPSAQCRTARSGRRSGIS